MPYSVEQQPEASYRSVILSFLLEDMELDKAIHQRYSCRKVHTLFSDPLKLLFFIVRS